MIFYDHGFDTIFAKFILVILQRQPSRYDNKLIYSGATDTIVFSILWYGTEVQKIPDNNLKSMWGMKRLPIHGLIPHQIPESINIICNIFTCVTQYVLTYFYTCEYAYVVGLQKKSKSFYGVHRIQFVVIYSFWLWWNIPVSGVNTMPADALTTKFARASAGMVMSV